MIRLLKIGGNELDDPAFIVRAAQVVKQMHDTPIIVHGGGKGIKTLTQKLRIDVQYIDGRRVIDPSTLEIIMMVLCGQMNLRLVAGLINAGVEAQGFNGADRGLIRAKPVLRPNGSLGRTGEISSVRTDILLDTLAAKIVPVIAPVLLGEDGGFFNINADNAASAIGTVIGVDQVVFLTNVPGILNNGTPIKKITHSQAQDLITSGTVTGGMTVKLNAALDALLAGVPQVVITDLRGLEEGTGTIVSVQ